MKVSQLIEQLKQLPDKSILTQVVANDGSVWNCFFEFNDVPKGDLIQLKIYHPELETLKNANQTPEV